jgi:hypothetical protein
MPSANAAERARRGLQLLAQGRYAQGWPLYEARFEVGRDGMAKPALPYPEWKGEDLVGKELLIWPEQGLGDQIQFARFAPILAARGARVTLICLPPLKALLSQLKDVQVLAAVGGVEFPDPDFWVMSGSLPRWMDITLETIPLAPYLVAQAAPRLPAARPRVGIVTHGSPSHSNDANRSLDLVSAQRLMNLVPGAVSLDPSSTGANNFADTACIVAGLDLVICVDTSAAHLAGAMGKPCWLMLPAVNTDWRWLQGRGDSPWYPSLRLFRQTRARDWSGVIDTISVELAKL